MKHLLLALVALLSGCAYTVHFDSVPQGARVYVDGSLMGSTPLAAELTDRGQASYNLRFELEGYVPEVGVIRPVATGQSYTTTNGTTTTATQTYGQATVRQPNPGGRVYGTGQATTVQTQAVNQTTTTHQVKSWPRHIVVTMRPRHPSDPMALQQQAPTQQPQQASSFCTSCGSKTAGKFCGACGSPTGK